MDGEILLGKTGWYSVPVRFADWRGLPPVDLATNPLVSRHYAGGDPVPFRVSDRAKVDSLLATGATLRIGLDYYALQGVCSGLVPPEILARHYPALMNAGVFLYQVVLQGDELVWEPLPAMDAHGAP